MKDSEILRDLISLAFDSDPADTAVTLMDCLDLLTRTVVAEQQSTAMHHSAARPPDCRSPAGSSAPPAAPPTPEAGVPGFVKAGGRGVLEKRAILERLLSFRQRNGLGCLAQIINAANGAVTESELYAMLAAERFPLAKWRVVGAALDHIERKEK